MPDEPNRAKGSSLGLPHVQHLAFSPPSPTARLPRDRRFPRIAWPRNSTSHAYSSLVPRLPLTAALSIYGSTASLLLASSAAILPHALPHTTFGARSGSHLAA